MASDLLAIVPSIAASTLPRFDADGIAAVVRQPRRPIHLVRENGTGRLGVAFATDGAAERLTPGCTRLATLPALYPEWLGDRSFCSIHGVRFPYVAGAMANGIATSELVIAMARAGMLGFFGAAGLLPERIEQALDDIEEAIGTSGASWGANLIHSPNEPALEDAVCALYLKRGVKRVSASAYVDLTTAVVRFAASGLTETPDGAVRRRHHVFAKVSRPEVARRFMSPAPPVILEALLARGHLTAREAELAARVPVAEDVTVEADSGGHTDNRALGTVFPVMARLRDALCIEHRYPRPIRLGAAGGLGTPAAVASAFALGASYVVTGSINQCAVEAGLSPAGRALLAQADTADVAMAPAADMFEQGVEVQVLKRGTMFGSRAHRLLAAYRAYASLDAIGAAEREKLERQVLGVSFDEVRGATRAFWADRDPSQNEIAARDPKHEMALCFRWYLGLSSRWAITGEPSRRLDYQIWCGPAMAAFNEWVRGSFLEPPENRTVVQIARNLLEGAAVLTRAHQLRNYGAPVPASAFRFSPRVLE